MRIIFVTSFPPFPLDRSGGGIRSRLLLDALAQCGEVKILYLDYRSGRDDLLGAPESPFASGDLVLEANIPVRDSGDSRIAHLSRQILRAMRFTLTSGYGAAGIEICQAARAHIDGLIQSGEVDLVVGRLTRPTAVAGLLEGLLCPLIVDADDWEPSRSASAARSAPRSNPARSFFLRRYLKGSVFLADKLLRQADHIWLASQSDVAGLARDHVTTLPNLPLANLNQDITPCPPSHADAIGLFAVGQWKQKQNSDGMSWFLAEVWPRVLALHPNARLRIAGGVPEPLAKAWRDHRCVELLGFVDDLSPEYERAAVALAPITWGGGTKIKVLEALAHGRVPAGPEHAFEGLSVSDNSRAFAIVENGPDELAAGIAELLDDPQARNFRERNALEFYCENFSKERFDLHVRATVAAVMDRKSSR